MTQKILIVDDSTTQRLTLKLKLERQGYKVIEATNGMEAIQSVYEQMPDLVLSDVIMPSINGYHLCRLIKRDNITKHIPVILLTVLDKKLDKFWGLHAGADDFFCKDSSDEELYQKISDLISQSKVNTNTIKIDDITQYDFTSKVADILDESLVKSTLANEFRDLAEFVLDEKMFRHKLLNFLSSILDYNLMGIFYCENYQKDKILYFVQDECDVDTDVLTAIKEKIISDINYRNSNKQELKLEHKMLKNITLDSFDYPNIKDISEFKSEYIVPIMNEGQFIGAIALFHKNLSQYNNVNLLNSITTELRTLLKIKWLYSETKMLSVVDPLTQLYNRRYFQQVLEKEFLRSNRYTSPLSIAMIDIDNFKSLNDTYGHQFGDEVLQVTAKLFQDSLRKTDYAARYGGEELIAILPESMLEQAITPMERFRSKLAAYPFVYNSQNITVTVSIGIVENNFRYTTTDNFVKDVDTALYEAKQNGKNRIELTVNRK